MCVGGLFSTPRTVIRTGRSERQRASRPVHEHARVAARAVQATGA
jgi:hypothetical protein